MRRGSQIHRGAMTNNSPQAKTLRIDLAENALCAKVGKVLVKNYPGWTWDINCTLSTGIITVKCLNLHGEYGFVLYISQIEQPGGEGIAVSAGGELLERCNVPRGKKPQDLTLERDIRGNAANMDLDVRGTS